MPDPNTGEPTEREFLEGLRYEDKFPDPVPSQPARERFRRCPTHGTTDQWAKDGDREICHEVVHDHFCTKPVTSWEPVSQSQPATLRGAAQGLLDAMDAHARALTIAIDSPLGATRDEWRAVKDAQEELRSALASLPDGQGDVREAARIGDCEECSGEGKQIEHDRIVGKCLACDGTGAKTLADLRAEAEEAGELSAKLGEKEAILAGERITLYRGVGREGENSSHWFGSRVDAEERPGYEGIEVREALLLPAPSVTEEQA